jgi:hypothetical protein
MQSARTLKPKRTRPSRPRIPIWSPAVDHRSQTSGDGKRGFSVLRNGKSFCPLCWVRRQRAPYNVQALDYSVVQKSLLSITWHLLWTMDGWGQIPDTWTAGPRLFWFQSPLLSAWLLHIHSLLAELAWRNTQRNGQVLDHSIVLGDRFCSGVATPKERGVPKVSTRPRQAQRPLTSGTPAT